MAFEILPQCISEKAESAAEAREYNGSDFQYYSSKYSNVVNEPKVELPEGVTENEDMYLTLELNHDTHFYNLAVDTARSSVHVPTNIYDKRKYSFKKRKSTCVFLQTKIQPLQFSGQKSWMKFLFKIIIQILRCLGSILEVVQEF